MTYYLFLLSLLVLLSSLSRDATGTGLSTSLILRLGKPGVDPLMRRLTYKSLNRKILALTGTKHSEVIDAIVNDLLEDGGEVFFNPVNGDYHLIKDGAREDDPLGRLHEYLYEQHSDGFVFDLRRDIFYAGEYKSDQNDIVYSHHPLQLSDNYVFVSDDAYYQDLQADLLARIAAITNKTKTPSYHYFAGIAKKISKEKNFNLLELLRLRDHIVDANDPILSDLFESFYYAVLERSGIEGDVQLSSIDERLAKLSAGTNSSFSSPRSYFTFRHQYTWNRVEFEHYLLDKAEKLGADSLARLRLMENDKPHLRPVLDEILAQYNTKRADFEQALVEVSRVFHLLDIDTPIPRSNQERVNKLLAEVAIRKNKVLQDYFNTLVVRSRDVSRSSDAPAHSAYAFLQRIYLMEDMIALKKKTSQPQTVRKLLEELGIDVDVYIDYTSNIRHYDTSLFYEQYGARLVSRDRMMFISEQIKRYEKKRVATHTMLSNIVTAIHTNFPADKADTLLISFLELQPGVSTAQVVEIEVIAP